MSDSSPQRQRILDSAVTILAEKGQSGLTVRAVAQASNFSTTGIYTWFGGKDGLLEAIYSDGFARFRTHVASADSDPSPRSRLYRSGELYWEWALANPTHYLLMFSGVPSSFTPSPEAIAEADLAFTDLIERAAAFTDEDVAHHIWATLHGYAMLQIAIPKLENSVALEQMKLGLDRLLEQIEAKAD
jgi:AcrR family transcriptional regulator